MTKVAAVILAGNAAEAERQARIALGRGADLVELRLDGIAGLGSETVRHLAKALGERAIATVRSHGQGGESREGRAGRSSLLREICGQRFAYVDLELKADAEGLDRSPAPPPATARRSSCLTTSPKRSTFIECPKPSTRAGPMATLPRSCSPWATSAAQSDSWISHERGAMVVLVPSS